MSKTSAERSGEKVIDKEGKDVTHNFQEGAYRCFLECLQEAVRRGERLDGAILKANSPSCGYREIYDGTFTGTLVEGNGVFAQIVERIHRDNHGEGEYKMVNFKERNSQAHSRTYRWAFCRRNPWHVGSTSGFQHGRLRVSLL